MKKLISIAIFAVFSASSAMSAGFSPSIGVSYNNSAFAGEGTEKNFDEDGSLKTQTKEYGAFADDFVSVFVEMSITDNLSIGLDYVPQGIESPENFSREGNKTQGAFPDPGQSKVSVDFNDLTTLYLKANIPMLGGAYVKGGFAQVDIEVIESMASGNTYADTDTKGFIAAIGYSHEITDGLSLRAEVMAHQFDDAETDNGVGKSSGSSANGGRNEVKVAEMWGARGTISLVKSF